MEQESKSTVGLMVYFVVMLTALLIHPFGLIIGAFHCVFSIATVLVLTMYLALSDIMTELENSPMRIFPTLKSMLLGKPSIGAALPVYICMFIIGMCQFSGLIPRVVAWAFGGDV